MKKIAFILLLIFTCCESTRTINKEVIHFNFNKEYKGLLLFNRNDNAQYFICTSPDNINNSSYEIKNIKLVNYVMILNIKDPFLELGTSKKINFNEIGMSLHTNQNYEAYKVKMKFYNPNPENKLFESCYYIFGQITPPNLAKYYTDTNQFAIKSIKLL